MHVVQQKRHCIRVVFFRLDVTETLTNFMDFSDRSELFGFNFDEISFSYALLVFVRSLRLIQKHSHNFSKLKFSKMFQ